MQSVGSRLHQEQGGYRRGFRPRGGRSFGTWRGGFAGRSSRSRFGGNNQFGHESRSFAEGHWEDRREERKPGGKEGSKLIASSGKLEADGTQVGQQSSEGKKIEKMEGILVFSEQGRDACLLEDHKSNGEAAKLGSKVLFCSKCTQKGHVVADCVSDVFCDICESREHVNHKCPILKLPKPSVQAVGYAVEGLGFNHIHHPPLQRSKKGTKTALVKVIGGSLSKDRLIDQLQRICPGNWNWDPKISEEGAYVVPFPSRIELQRAINFGGADVKEGGVFTSVRVQFEEWFEKEEGYLLPKVWIRVFGLRKKLREYLTLWAVGSLVGATQLVDMKTTRKSDFGRIFVAVLDPAIIPRKMDVVIGDHYFELMFEMEKKGFDENGEEVEFEQEDKDGDGAKEGEKELEEEGRDLKRARNDDMVIDGKPGEDGEVRGVGSHGGQQEDEVFFADKIADQVIQVAMEKVLGEVYDKVEDEEKLRAAMSKKEKEGNEPK
ncbi:uncharacterized protein LOC107304414 [Oryza brachyantha]|uniref:uncharacterized protein LOC107304414 n=1 Tax=Oryza brachyantha TaxID=4533 RepID=UPI0007766271|nr:uncharacterized protein LOC107304414 [Oryza brachyantha]